MSIEYDQLILNTSALTVVVDVLKNRDEGFDIEEVEVVRDWMIISVRTVLGYPEVYREIRNHFDLVFVPDYRGKDNFRFSIKAKGLSNGVS